MNSTRRDSLGGSEERLDLRQAAEDFKRAYVAARNERMSMLRGRPVSYRPPAGYDSSTGVYLEGGLELTRPRPSVWQTTAAKLLKLGLPIVEYTHFQLRQADLDKHVPEPSQLVTPDRIAFWNRQKNKQVDSARVRLTMELDAVQRELNDLRANGVKDTPETLAYVLDRQYLQVSHLFRYCLARKALEGQDSDSLKQVARKYAKPALMQYMANQTGYSQAWQSILPGPFVEKAQARYRQLCDSVMGG